MTLDNAEVLLRETFRDRESAVPNPPPALMDTVRARARRRGRARAVTVVAAAAATLAGGGAAVAGMIEPPTPTPTPLAGAGFTDFRATRPELLTAQHRAGRITYPVAPPVGGDHSSYWQNCTGDVYDAPVADEHAVHSLEHGAVWITYRPGLAADDVSALAAKVRGRGYLFMSPYPGLDAPISLQAWGYQLTVASGSDPRIDEFIASYRISAATEPGAPCSGGVTATGADAVDAVP